MPKRALAAFLCIAALPPAAAAEWTAHVDHDRTTCSVTNGEITVWHPDRTMSWRVPIVPNEVVANNKLTFADDEHTYDLTIHRLYEDGATDEWVWLPGGLLVMVDARGFNDSWNVCLTSVPS